MKPIDQTEFVDVHGRGNCVRACVASLLELSLEEVPMISPNSQELESMLDTFLQSIGKRRIGIYFGGGFEQGDVGIHSQLMHPIANCYVNGGPVMVFGKSPRGAWNHAVVMKSNGLFMWELVHDPHPDRTGIVGYPKSIHFVVPEN